MNLEPSGQLREPLNILCDTFNVHQGSEAAPSSLGGSNARSQNVNLWRWMNLWMNHGSHGSCGMPQSGHNQKLTF